MICARRMQLACNRIIYKKSNTVKFYLYKNLYPDLYFWSIHIWSDHLRVRISCTSCQTNALAFCSRHLLLFLKKVKYHEWQLRLALSVYTKLRSVFLEFGILTEMYNEMITIVPKKDVRWKASAWEFIHSIYGVCRFQKTWYLSIWVSLKLIKLKHCSSNCDGVLKCVVNCKLLQF